LRHWLSRGVDGVRLDAINRLGKDPALRDNVAGQPLRQQDWPSLHEYLRQVRALVDEYPDAVTVGEVWEFEQRRIMPYLSSDELHLAHNFVFARAPFDAGAIRRMVEEFDELAPPGVWPAWFFNNHDEPRIVSRWSAPTDDDHESQLKGRLAATLLLTLRGTPFLYQGEELGLPDTDLPPGVGDDRDGRDPQRTPMPWQPPSLAGAGAGFTLGEPWLPVGSTAERRNVASELHDDTSMLALYRDLLALRRSRPSLRAGAQEFLDAPADVLAYLRRDGDECSLVVLNFASRPQWVDIPALVGPDWSAEPVLRTTTELLPGTAGVPGGTQPGTTVALEPLGGIVCDVAARESAAHRGASLTAAGESSA
jgi:alpha-glucosidase